MSNPIREFLEKNPAFVPARRDVEQWADAYDKLLDPWTRVEDDIPASGTELLFRTEHGAVYSGWVNYYNENNIEWLCNGRQGIATIAKITHWMIVPPLPKGPGDV
jgi:hypothetical protein